MAKGKRFEWTDKHSSKLRKLPKECNTVCKACDYLGIPRSTVYEPDNVDALRAIKQAVECNEEAIENEAIEVVIASMRGSPDERLRIASAKIILDRQSRKREKYLDKEIAKMLAGTDKPTMNEGLRAFYEQMGVVQR